MGGILSPFGDIDMLDELKDQWTHESKVSVLDRATSYHTNDGRTLSGRISSVRYKASLNNDQYDSPLFLVLLTHAVLVLSTIHLTLRTTRPCTN
jgi:hypothetical protein